MANYVLKPVFSTIFGHDFDRYSFDDRLEMQKSIYLLQDLGVSVGDYNFMWYKHGPYSQTLQNDILGLSNTGEADVRFSEEAKRMLSRLKGIISNQEISYNRGEWAECLGSLHYIKENLLPSNASDEMLLSELEKRKPHLNKIGDNKMALSELKTLYG